ncbi:L-serine ammonia-lyase [endosymbiont of unidentified scaly snail isolate Monju]|uniref:L-serine ammonia-lyase n=1 Tax=endosymbiont of unidentified scaly snail isolate Monju TaxID=1248727 RepID=UPI0003892707|nr:L-serine ammonia-lyase [endosymbiont of unidentified scaly snail isolate Monju]BAN68916.1 L-serine dehydratase [endosymbiont of unidentified scaly snail isolate Monju]
MFISTLDLFKIGIGPSSSHTMGPMHAAYRFRTTLTNAQRTGGIPHATRIRCTLKGSLSATGRGHATDRAVLLGLHGHLPEDVAREGLDAIVARTVGQPAVTLDDGRRVTFDYSQDIVFDDGPPLPQHPNALILELLDESGNPIVTETYFSIGGGFIARADELAEDGENHSPESAPRPDVPYPFDSARRMLEMATASGLGIAEMKRANELTRHAPATLDAGLDRIWQYMRRCVMNGLEAEGVLPGGLNIPRRAASLLRQVENTPECADTLNIRLCAYAMAVNEENAAGQMVVTAPTNGAAGVIPAILYAYMRHEDSRPEQAREFLLTAAAIGGLIKHRSSISGAEVGCQGEVGSASAMAAAGLCAVRGGTPAQIEHAAEMALEHHLGMTCDPVKGLVQVPCIERNGFGGIKAHVAATLALHGDGQHFMPLDHCIAAMKQTGEEMSTKFKETSRGGLAVSIIEC